MTVHHRTTPSPRDRDGHVYHESELSIGIVVDQRAYTEHPQKLPTHLAIRHVGTTVQRGGGGGNGKGDGWTDE
jgi:hypothetical protein